MKGSEKLKNMLKIFEEGSLVPKLKAYLCPANKWTIAWGNTFYEDGSRVKAGDVITFDRADKIFSHVLSKFETEVTSVVKSKVNQNQFDALLSFAWNLGTDIDEDTIAEGLGDSTLLKKVNANPNDPTIPAEFLKWNKAVGKVVPGLTKRRLKEADLYQGKI